MLVARADDRADHRQDGEDREDRHPDTEDPRLALLAGTVGDERVLEVRGGEAADRSVDRIAVEGDGKDLLGGGDDRE